MVPEENDDIEEVFEEIETPASEHADTPVAENAHSAFENVAATFYV